MAFAHENTVNQIDWEGCWAPYDEDTYAATLSFLQPDDVLLDIGAGDLRFARRAATHVRHIYAIERRPELLIGPNPSNLHVICGDARLLPFPKTVTVAVLLMRHCAHFKEYCDKLLASGCTRLITNARWHLGVEAVDLAAPRIPFSQLSAGWYVCACGTTGLQVSAQPGELLDIERVVEVSDCPVCRAMAINENGVAVP